MNLIWQVGKPNITWSLRVRELPLFSEKNSKKKKQTQTNKQKKSLDMMITQEKTLETGQERRAVVTFLKPVCKIPSTQLRLRPAPTQDQSEQRDSIYLQLKQCNLKKKKVTLLFIWPMLSLLYSSLRQRWHKLCLQPQALFLWADAKSRNNCSINSMQQQRNL